MSKYIEAPEEFDGQGQGRMPAVGSGWVGCDLLQALTRLATLALSCDRKIHSANFL